MATFHYEEAFIRNIGWVTEVEQQQLRTKKIAISGCGGVGGWQLLLLARLGVANFNIADFDKFELANFNRQVGATVSSLNDPKVEVMSKMALDINPEINFHLFEKGLDENNIDDFLKDVDLYVDGIDFYALSIREKIFKRCRELNIPAITAAPLGMGTSYIIFMPDQMSFEDYFCLNGLSDHDKQLNYLIGLSPKTLSYRYLIDKTTTNLEQQRGPSTVVGCQLCASVVGAQAVKILLRRGSIYSAPYYHSFDAYLDQYHRGKLWWGNRNPIQILKRMVIKHLLTQSKMQKLKPYSLENPRVIEKILDISRWTPSGDNIQPWKFEIKNDNHVLIHIEGLSEDLYDFAGIPTIITAGMLLENIRIAASHEGLRSEYAYQKISEHKHLLDVTFFSDTNIKPDPLYHFIFSRSVNRGKYKITPLTAREKQMLQAEIEDAFELRWFESRDDRLKMANINALSTEIRLRVPELYQLHQDIIDEKHFYSQDKIPVDATGLGLLSKRLMLWSRKDASRLNFLINHMGAARSTAKELDIGPGLCCSAHFILVPKQDGSDYPSSEILLRAGHSLQRFWLMATKLGLAMQPSIASLSFAYYFNHQIHFTKQQSLLPKVKQMTEEMHTLFGTDNVLFKGRIGVPTSNKMHSRSARKPLSDLLVTK